VCAAKINRYLEGKCHSSQKWKIRPGVAGVCCVCFVHKARNLQTAFLKDSFSVPFLALCGGMELDLATVRSSICSSAAPHFQSNYILKVFKNEHKLNQLDLVFNTMTSYCKGCQTCVIYGYSVDLASATCVAEYIHDMTCRSRSRGWCAHTPGQPDNRIMDCTFLGRDLSICVYIKYLDLSSKLDLSAFCRFPL